MSLLFGVEIEVTRGKTTWAAIKTTEFSRWYNVSDCSIYPNGREFVSPKFRWEERGQVFDVVEDLQDAGARCNQSRGFHVHMSGKFPVWDQSLKQYLEAWYEKLQPGFKPARHRREEYCTDFDNPIKGERYHFVRFVGMDSGHLHIELRFFNAFLCKRWVARCLWEAKKLGDALEQMAQEAVQVV